MIITLCQQIVAMTWFLPEQGSSVSGDVDNVFFMITVICAIFAIGITGTLICFAIRYRRVPGRVADSSLRHNIILETMWSVLPAGLLALIFAMGMVTFIDMATVPDEAYEIQVIGKSWVWSFVYPNGYVDNDLHVPVDRPVRLVMSSDDVIHSLYIPAFRVKQDLIPGRYTKMWFEANRVGEFDLFCTEYCGTKHSDMYCKVVVHPPGEFEKWLRDASNFMDRMSPAEAGELLYKRRGCAQCHSVDGSKMVGPTFWESFGEEAMLDSGDTIVVDENYIRQSILEPQAKGRAGYRRVMPTYQGQLTEAEINALIAYIKTLKPSTEVSP